MPTLYTDVRSFRTSSASPNITANLTCAVLPSMPRWRPSAAPSWCIVQMGPSREAELRRAEGGADVDAGALLVGPGADNVLVHGA